MSYTPIVLSADLFPLVLGTNPGAGTVIKWRGVTLDPASMAAPGDATIPVFDLGLAEWRAVVLSGGATVDNAGVVTITPTPPLPAVSALATHKVVWFSGQSPVPASAPASSTGDLWGWNTFSFAAGNLGVTHPALTSASRLAATNRVVTASSSPITVSMGIQETGQTIAWRGNAANLGGFFFVCRIAIEAYGAGVPLDTFVGLFGPQAALIPPAATNWVTDTTMDKLGIAFHTTSAGGLVGNWQLVESGGGGTVTAHDLGPTFALTVGDYIEVQLSATPNDNKVTYKISNLTSGATAAGILNTTLPVNTDFLAPYVQMNVQSTGGGGTGTTRFSISQMYLECFDG